ncbi:uncharacterized protein F5Z01DRAFT_209206 [Emericellopsis atlantica]|uniref:Uncharacterized protein n=1 Tax=Emericellopsis atlantica TaxID=2614577 RepID=A0A9P7ZUM0_9HYPO|nr:uncharacterized protein F5Z01DRAFT_209206 [Emericellopsis atlantica]KAG9258649.1 hypothetical protein F5Z01DRAFT_209206 [Emericellopsis atlantica]
MILPIQTSHYYRQHGQVASPAALVRRASSATTVATGMAIAAIILGMGIILMLAVACYFYHRRITQLMQASSHKPSTSRKLHREPLLKRVRQLLNRKREHEGGGETQVVSTGVECQQQPPIQSHEPHPAQVPPLNIVKAPRPPRCHCGASLQHVGTYGQPRPTITEHTWQSPSPRHDASTRSRAIHRGHSITCLAQLDGDARNALDSGRTTGKRQDDDEGECCVHIAVKGSAR